MALILADVGADTILNAFLNDSWPAGGKSLTIKLFTNNYDPVDTSVAGNFTEASGGGYASLPLASGSWTVSSANDPSDGVYAQQTWTFTGALAGSATVYGYFIVDADGVLVWAEKLGATFTPFNNGDILKITPKVQASKGTPT